MKINKQCHNLFKIAWANADNHTKLKIVVKYLDKREKIWDYLGEYTEDNNRLNKISTGDPLIILGVKKYINTEYFTFYLV